LVWITFIELLDARLMLRESLLDRVSFCNVLTGLREAPNASSACGGASGYGQGAGIRVHRYQVLQQHVGDTLP
jgi:hypothetical protein